MQKYIDKTKSLIRNEILLKNIPKTPEAVFSKDITNDKKQHQDDKKDHEIVEVKYMDELYSKAFLDDYFVHPSPPKT
jgi:hypothetical protein